MANLVCIIYETVLYISLHAFRPAGYRHISLRNECNQPQGVATLFVHIRVTDYIPDAFAGARMSAAAVAVVCSSCFIDRLALMHS